MGSLKRGGVLEKRWTQGFAAARRSLPTGRYRDVAAEAAYNGCPGSVERSA